jgi:hypothetical protein
MLPIPAWIYALCANRMRAASHQKCSKQPFTSRWRFKLANGSCAGDKRRPACKRCEIKGLECSPVPKNRFSHHSLTARNDAGISKDQTWVNCKPKSWRSPKRTMAANGSPPAQSSPLSPCGDRDPIPRARMDVEPAVGSQTLIDSSSPLEPTIGALHNTAVYNTLDHGHVDIPHQTQGASPGTTEALNFSSPASLPTSFHSAPYTTATTDAAGYSTKDQTNFRHLIGSQEHNSPPVDGSHTRRPATRSSNAACTTIDNLQESCLLRYFIEELSAWVSGLHFTITLHKVTSDSSTTAMNKGISNSWFPAGLSTVLHFETPFSQHHRAACIACPNTEHRAASSTAASYSLN